MKTKIILLVVSALFLFFGVSAQEAANTNIAGSDKKTVVPVLVKNLTDYSVTVTGLKDGESAKGGRNFVVIDGHCRQVIYLYYGDNPVTLTYYGRNGEKNTNSTVINVGKNSRWFIRMVKDVLIFNNR